MRRRRPPALSSCAAGTRCAARCASSRCSRSTRSASTRRSSRACAKAAVRDDWDLDGSAEQAYHYVDLRVRHHRAAVRALGPLRQPLGAARPARHRRVALLGDGRDADLRRGRRPGVLQLLHLLRLAAVRVVIVSALRWVYDLLRACCCAPPATTAARCSSAPATTSTPSATRCADTPSIEVVGFISLTPRPDNGLRSLGALDDLPEILERAPRSTRSSSPTRRSRPRGDRARRRLPPARRAGARRAVDDGDPRPSARTSSRASRCRCSSSARRSSRASTTSSSAASTSPARRS